MEHRKQAERDAQVARRDQLRKEADDIDRQLNEGNAGNQQGQQAGQHPEDLPHAGGFEAQRTQDGSQPQGPSHGLGKQNTLGGTERK